MQRPPAPARRRFALLLGAGASYGAWRDGPSSTPPLGPWLFSELVTTFPRTWGSLSDERKQTFEADEDRGLGFEQGMVRLWQEDGQGDLSVQSLLTDMALYFAKFRLPSDCVDCYSGLLAALGRAGLVGDRLGVATLNYECLLEEAASRLRLPVDPAPLPPRVGVLTLWKPHGACNLVLEPVANGHWRNIHVAAASVYAGGQGATLVPLDPDAVVQLYAAQTNIPPAMSLYAPGKHLPIAPEYIKASRERWAEWSRNAAVVVVIGARPVLEDTHVWAPVVHGKGEVWFVGDDDSAQVLRDAAGDERVIHLGNYFDAVLNSLAARFLVMA